MWDDVATGLLGMSAKDFNDLSAARFKVAGKAILDRKMRVKMYIANKISSFPTFTIKEVTFA